MKTLGWYLTIQAVMLISSPMLLLGLYVIGLAVMVVWSEK